MPTISTEVSRKEFDAIIEYANLCGETVSELVRKSLIREITLADGYGTDDPQYEYRMSQSESPSRNRDFAIIQGNYNKIRRILGWAEIKL